MIVLLFVNCLSTYTVGSDFEVDVGSQSITVETAGQYSIQINIFDDSVVEPDELFGVDLALVLGLSAEVLFDTFSAPIVTIVDPCKCTY